MPNFQGAVNNMLGTAALALTLNPELKAERAAKLAETKAQKLEEAYGGEVAEARKVVGDKYIPDNSPKRKEAEATIEDYNKRMTQAAEEALNANPTSERAKKFTEARSAGARDRESSRSASADALEKRVGDELNEEERLKEEAEARGEDPNTGEPMYVSRDESKMASSNQRAQKQVRAKGTQKRRFKDYLAKMETSLGGTVGDLPEDAQAYIASQYLAKDRKKIMDEEDRKGGKK